MKLSWLWIDFGFVGHVFQNRNYNLSLTLTKLLLLPSITNRIPLSGVKVPGFDQPSYPSYMHFFSTVSQFSLRLVKMCSAAVCEPAVWVAHSLGSQFPYKSFILVRVWFTLGQAAPQFHCFLLCSSIGYLSCSALQAKLLSWNKMYWMIFLPSTWVLILLRFKHVNKMHWRYSCLSHKDTNTC